MNGVRLTERARSLLALLLLLAVVVGCGWAFLTGERWRCERLRAAGSPLTSSYCPEGH